jgi:alpha-mannosidase
MGTAADFFERLNKSRNKLETWSGELYLEKHQGTLTTQAKVKRSNRKLEYLLKHVEFIYSCLPLPDYPVERMDKLWKTLLTNQFHDIIPGSSINRVYKEAHEQYAWMFDECRKLLAEAAAKLFVSDDDCLTVFNPLSCVYSGPVELPKDWLGASVDGKILASQVENGKVLVDADIPACGFLTLKKAELKTEAAAPVQSNTLILENDLVVYGFNKDGQLIKGYDKEFDINFIDADNPANVMSLYYDDPVEYDAWDIDLGYEEQLLENARGLKVAKSGGDVRQILDFELEIGNSKINQRIILGQGKRLDFETCAQWDEAHKMLRTMFPLQIHSMEAAFDIQYGYIKRFTGRNTSWDMARYEVAAHRYADISDSQYGAALLNDCKYGYKAHGNVLDLNLLRSPKYPDFTADIGEQVFTYSLLPHGGDLPHSNVLNNAAILNEPPLRFEGFRTERMVMPCELESDSVSMEVLKKAEKEDCLVVRLVETRGQRSKAELRFNSTPSNVVKTNMMEWTDEDKQGLQDNKLKIKLNPFEIRTYKVYFK